MTPAKQELNDLKLFADPFSASSFRDDERGTWTAEFERRGNRIALRRDGVGRIYSLADGSLLAGNFRSLLAGKDFADLEYLSRAIKHSYSSSDTNWMELPFSIDRGARSARSFKEVDQFLSELSCGGVVGLEGPAGAGKTHFIERLAFTRAARLASRLGDEPLVIPVTSAGKILSAIDDRIDGSLAALRAKFNRVELPALMRQRLIALAIDGFDELSDSRGYDNSWSALRELIGEVGQDSLIILSGRDSFIGIETLRKLIGASVELAGSKLHSVRLDFPSALDATQWIVEVRESWEKYSSELRQRLDSFYWLRRPFFVSQISQADPEAFLNSGDEPIVALCDDIVCREVHKIGLPSDVSEDSGKKIVYSILTEAARTMVDYEIDYVDAALLEVAVEVACEEHAPENVDFQRALAARARTLTLLEPAPSTGDPDNRTFPHEKIKAYFYSRHLIAEIGENSMIPLGIRRAQLSISDLAVLGALLSLETSSFSRELANKVSQLLTEQNATSTAFSNLAAIGLVCASDLAEERPFVLSGGAMMDALLTGKPSAQLRRVYINRLDISDADLHSCEFKECEVGELIISHITKIGKSRPEVHTVILQSTKGGESVYLNKVQISEVLGRETDLSARGDEFEVPDTLAILARMMLKSHWVRLSRDDKRGRRIVERDDWDATRNTLQAAGFLEVKNIGAGGRPDEFVHLRNAESFLKLNTASEDIQRVVKLLI
ncbi:hypothetical protein ORIO_09925 [Cereibacter azotoformans]|uniref:hypothetical protein n=1 Tax=Cereibacter azotoformans TaxID=43057 RepID=UPI001EEA580E|nr:hypothetical protein [Cereibacter azotoformans]ULB10221.1 hypothetical protein ORIO_09925 [Cereibacter azotoformans]